MQTKDKVSSAQKREVHDFWNTAACGENLYLHGVSTADFDLQSRRRYELEPFILDFARFEEAKGQKVLEIGTGLGADYQKFAEAGAELYGIDLTPRAVEYTQRRMECFGLSSTLNVGDAERLMFPEGAFDQVYSWGVLHHSPDTEKAISEVLRVLRPGGSAKIMIYHKWSMIGLMLWLRYGLLRFRPFTSLQNLYATHLESPGTKAYSVSEAHRLFRDFSDVRIRTVLSHGDLLESDAGQRHKGIALELAKRIWPRRIIRRFFPNAGLFMLI